MRDREITRAEFVTFVPSELLDAAAADAPPTRPALLVAARRFVAAVHDLWHAPRASERVKRDGEVIIVPDSLASHAAASRNYRNLQPSPWVMIHPPFQAWWRVAEVRGEVVRQLGMRATAAAQLKVPLPWVRDQDSLKAVGVRFGVIEPGSDPTHRARDGLRKQERLAVLTQAVSEELLAEPGADGCPKSARALRQRTGVVSAPGETDPARCLSNVVGTPAASG